MWIDDFKNRVVKAKDIFEIREIDKVSAYNFVRKYHYLGDAKFFAKYSYGLYHELEIVGVATFACPQGSEALKGWFGLPNSDKTIMELTRLCMLPHLNGTNATSYLLGGAMRNLKTKGIRAVITLATSDRHVGSIYQVCNFKYYGLTSQKNDFWSFETQNKPRGKVRDLQGVWVAKPQKHRYAYIIDKQLKCKYIEQKKPSVDMIVPYSCCGGTKIVHDNRFGVDYTCPICTKRLNKVENGREIKPQKRGKKRLQMTLFDFDDGFMDGYNVGYEYGWHDGIIALKEANQIQINRGRTTHELYR